jgi:hypothetical protein
MVSCLLSCQKNVCPSSFYLGTCRVPILVKNMSCLLSKRCIFYTYLLSPGACSVSSVLSGICPVSCLDKSVSCLLSGRERVLSRVRQEEYLSSLLSG